MFGPMVAPTVLETLMRDRLMAWMHDYLGEVSVLIGQERGYLPDVADWKLASDDADRFAEDQLPGILIALGEAELAHRADSIDADFEVTIYALVEAGDFADAHLLAWSYAFAALSICAQHLQGDPISAVTVDRLRVETGRPGQSRARAVGIVELYIYVDGLVDPSQGPDEPSDPPSNSTPPDWPEVDEVDIDVTLTD